nr:potassium channel family protein [Streptomyces radiopugnans]
MRLAFITAALLVAYYLLPVDEEFTGGTAVILVLGLLAVLALFLWEIREIEHSPRPILRAAEALVSVLLLFLLLFATVYHLLERAEPGSFTEPLTRTDALYFALTTFATVGYGDITARSQTARIIVMVQMAGGLLLVGVAARLVVDTVKSALRRRAPSEPEA